MTEMTMQTARALINDLLETEMLAEDYQEALSWILCFADEFADDAWEPTEE